jgi:hypothetical protein
MTKPTFRLWLTLAISFFFVATQAIRLDAACNAPYGLNTADIGTSTVDLIWTHEFPNTVIYYELEIRPVGQALTGVPTYTNISASDTTLTGLLSGQVYRCKVRAYCGDEYSPWSALVFTFRTLLTNPSRCGASYLIRDNICPAPNDQTFPILVQNQGDSLGKDVKLKAIRLILDHNWRSDLELNLISPDGTSIRILEGLNAGDDNIGNPNVANCNAFLELTNESGALPLGALYQVNNPTGRYLPRNSILPFNNLQSPNGIWKLVVCDKRTNNEGFLKWVELVFERADCLAPTALIASNITKHTANISWQKDPVLCDSFFLEWGVSGFLPGMDNNVGGGAGILKLPCSVTLPLTLSGLNAFQRYDVYVRRSCGTGLYSENSFAEHFFTDCAPSLEEKFDNQSVCNSACAASCNISGLWQNISVGDNYDWKIWNGAAPSTPNTGPYEEADGKNGNYLYFETTCMPSSKDSVAILKSRCIKIEAPSAQDCHFGFDYFMWNTSISSALGKLSIEISLDGGLTWVVLKQYSGSQGKGWKHERINLSTYHNSIATFRIVATGSVSQTCDIALDNLRFYGSTDIGAPDFTYYRDVDGDGYGDVNKTFFSCSATPPNGYKSISGDCNDQNASIYPNANEVLCNLIDENCNGNIDDKFIPSPSVIDVAVCKGETLTLQANSVAKGTFYWFDATINGNLLQTGATLSIPNFQNTQTFYLIDSIPSANGGCSSTSLPVQGVANTTPVLTLMTEPQICEGESFELTSLAIFDQEGTNGMLTYHSGLPANNLNKLTTTLVSPTSSSTYYVLSTTPSSCKDVISVNLKVNQRPITTITNGDSTSICKNGTKKLVANVTHGNSPYTYAWSNGLNFKTIDIFGNPTGNVTDIYKVTVTDSLGCKSDDFIKIRTLGSVTQTNINTVQQVSSCGGNDGSITLTPQNGSFPMKFSWSGATTGSITGVNGAATISGLKQGNYRITVTDNSIEGCFMVMPLIVLNALGLQVQLDTIENPACYGAATGAIRLDVQGTAPTYQWSNSMTSKDLNNIGAGNYSVTITDGACQQILDNLGVISVDSIKILPNQITNVSCFGMNNGAIDVAIFGGNGNYQTEWSNNAITQDISNLTAGFYDCLVTDMLGCSNVKRFFVTQPPVLDVSLIQTNTIKCYNNKDAAIEAMPSGGAGVYDFNWSNGDNTQTINGLDVGQYSLTLTDQNGCTKVRSQIITQPSLLVFDSIQVTNPVCVGANNGSIKIVGGGGTLPHFYMWNNGNTSAIQSSLSPQTYSITLSDANGCTNTAENIELTTQQLLNLQLDSLKHVSCFGGTDAIIAITVTGGQGALQYRWNEFPEDDLLENIFAGIFKSTVKDARGCTISDTFEVLQPSAPLSTSIVSLRNPNCFGEFGGSIEVQTLGGTEPYSFSWSNNATTQNINELTIGTYQLSVTDANGCTTQIAPQIIEEPTILEISPIIQDIPCNGTVGSIVSNVSGGVLPYSYHWNTNEISPNIYQLPQGNYSISVQDAHGCLIKIDSIPILNTNLSFNIQQEDFKNISCFGAGDAMVSVKLLGGNAPFRFAWSQQTAAQNAVLHPFERDTLTQLSPGIYRVLAIDKDGCVTPELTLQIAETPLLQWRPATLTMVECKYASTGAIETNVSGGFPPYSFDWATIPDEVNPQGLSAGFYRSTVTDINGCTLISPIIEISEPSLGIEIMKDSLWNDNCFNCQGAIYLHTEGGVLPYTYNWDEGTMEQDLSGLCAGSYTLTVSDFAGCTNTATYSIVSMGNLLQLNANIQDVPCKGESSGSIETTPLGGTPSYTLTWNTGNQGEIIQNIPAGDYSATLTDMAGCVKYFSFIVGEPDAVLQFNYTTDSLQSGWTILPQISGGVEPYSTILYNAQYQVIPQPTGLISGIYHCVVTDFVGCRLEINDIVVGTVATKENHFIKKINISPNPSNFETEIEVITNVPFAFSYEIVDPLGRPLLKKVFEEKKDAWKENITLDVLPNGFYWIKIMEANRVVKVMKLIKT